MKYFPGWRAGEAFTSGFITITGSTKTKTPLRGTDWLWRICRLIDQARCSGLSLGTAWPALLSQQWMSRGSGKTYAAVINT